MWWCTVWWILFQRCGNIVLANIREARVVALYFFNLYVAGLQDDSWDTTSTCLHSCIVHGGYATRVCGQVYVYVCCMVGVCVCGVGGSVCVCVWWWGVCVCIYVGMYMLCSHKRI
jgi:hypothetical protein